jgi:hypothetical protein
MDDITREYGSARLSAVSENNDFAYHRIEIEADESYEIDLWKDGAIARGRDGYKLKENTNPGIDLAIETDGPLEPVREQIAPGRSSEASHYADLRDFDHETLENASETVTRYLEEAGEPEETQEAVKTFFSEIDSGLLD